MTNDKGSWKQPSDYTKLMQAHYGYAGAAYTETSKSIAANSHHFKQKSPTPTEVEHCARRSLSLSNRELTLSIRISSNGNTRPNPGQLEHS
jgi:hypothetical protein